LSSSSDDSGGSSPLSWKLVKGALPGLKTFLKAFPLIGATTATILLGSDNDPGLLTDPRGFIVDVIEGWIIGSIFIPMFNFAIDVFEAIASSFLYVAFGSDRAVGVYTSIGLLDIPMYLVTTLIAQVSPAGSAILGVMGTVNAAIASIAADAGIAAPIILPALQLGWIALGMWLAWTVVSAIDIPGIRLVPLISRILAPVRRFFRRFR